MSFIPMKLKREYERSVDASSDIKVFAINSGASAPPTYHFYLVLCSVVPSYPRESPITLTSA